MLHHLPLGQPNKSIIPPSASFAKKTTKKLPGRANRQPQQPVVVQQPQIPVQPVVVQQPQIPEQPVQQPQIPVQPVVVLQPQIPVQPVVNESEIQDSNPGASGSVPSQPVGVPQPQIPIRSDVAQESLGNASSTVQNESEIQDSNPGASGSAPSGQDVNTSQDSLGDASSKIQNPNHGASGSLKHDSQVIVQVPTHTLATGQQSQDGSGVPTHTLATGQQSQDGSGVPTRPVATSSTNPEVRAPPNWFHIGMEILSGNFTVLNQLSRNDLTLALMAFIAFCFVFYVVLEEFKVWLQRWIQRFFHNNK